MSMVFPATYLAVFQQRLGNKILRSSEGCLFTRGKLKFSTGRCRVSPTPEIFFAFPATVTFRHAYGLVATIRMATSTIPPTVICRHQMTTLGVGKAIRMQSATAVATTSSLGRKCVAAVSTTSCRRRVREYISAGYLALFC